MVRKVKFDLEKAKVAFSTFLLLTIFTVIIFQFQTKPTRVLPDRLVIIIPSQLAVGQEETLRISAVNDKGEYLSTRNDLIEVSIVTQRNASIGLKKDSTIIWSTRLEVRLKNGITDIWFKGGGTESVIVTARDIEKNFHLEEATTTLYVGVE